MHLDLVHILKTSVQHTTGLFDVLSTYLQHSFSCAKAERAQMFFIQFLNG